MPTAEDNHWPYGILEPVDGYGYGPTLEVPDHHVINFDSPERISQPGYGFTVDIPDTPFVGVLWTDRVAMAVGVWKYHIARRATPERPIPVLKLHMDGWETAYYDGEAHKWVSDADTGILPVAGVETQLGVEGYVIALKNRQNNSFHRASTTFPRPPMALALQGGQFNSGALTPYSPARG
ncbi:hypothetical protein MIND_00020400 [Mycena indigotica]|uniref:Uncharacterized protein n=1 Tax=Mycena indigotica TaxID=2126181 RepID=A0A8H6WEQ7_9AGAR|nr:uncharacterized protein MIND_00020400 [Mycena indigotica]KAF7315062.1 hypothetical protein MIND_00020400 [Mycena indigotica]